MNNDIWNFMDIFILGVGVYALYAAWILKREGKIVRTFLVFKETDISACKDLQAYANLMSPRLGALTGVMIIYSILALVNSYVMDIRQLCLAAVGALILVLIWYGMEVKKAMKKYF